METKIKFTQWQIEDILFKDMVKSKEVSNVAHLIQIQPHYENSEITGINVTARQKAAPDKESKIAFNINQIESLMFKEMVQSREVSSAQHYIKIDFNIDNKLTILSLDVTTKELDKSLKTKS